MFVKQPMEDENLFLQSWNVVWTIITCFGEKNMKYYFPQIHRIISLGVLLHPTQKKMLHKTQQLVMSSEGWLTAFSTQSLARKHLWSFAAHVHKQPFWASKGSAITPHHQLLHWTFLNLLIFSAWRWFYYITPLQVYINFI